MTDGNENMKLVAMTGNHIPEDRNLYCHVGPSHLSQNVI